MTDTSPTNADDLTRHADESRDAPERPADLISVVVEHDGEPDECTLYPEAATDDDLVTKWITAEEGSYVDAEEMR